MVQEATVILALISYTLVVVVRPVHLSARNNLLGPSTSDALLPPSLNLARVMQLD